MFLVMGVCGREDLKNLRDNRDLERRVIRDAGAIDANFVRDFQVQESDGLVEAVSCRWSLIQIFVMYLHRCRLCGTRRSTIVYSPTSGWPLTP